MRKIVLATTQGTSGVGARARPVSSTMVQNSSTPSDSDDPPEMHGRVMSLMSLDRGLVPLGATLAGVLVLGRANGKLEGNLHVMAPDGTPMANAMLSLLHLLGVDDMGSFGDSTGELPVNPSAFATAAG